MRFGGKKLPAKSCQLVLYSTLAMAENNEQSCDADWEVISINASPVEGEEVPIPIGALIANYFEFSGGTKTEMTPEQFIAQLKASAIWWADKSHAAPTPDLDAAHKHSSHNKDELEASTKLGCFYCLGNNFQVEDIKKWIDDGDTAVCPCCGIDSVIGDSSGFDINQDLLEKMCQRWFSEENSE